MLVRFKTNLGLADHKHLDLAVDFKKCVYSRDGELDVSDSDGKKLIDFGAAEEVKKVKGEAKAPELKAVK